MKTLDLPGGVGISHLRVYDTEAPDGLRSGSAHVHLVCKEAYLVMAGEGSVQTLSSAGYREIDLVPGKLVWFTPGLIHRLVNKGGLEIMVVMANVGMPEAGDFAFTFPVDVMRDDQAYMDAASLAANGHAHATSEETAASRRDLAVEGFLALRKAFERKGASALTNFYRMAAQRAQGQIEVWQRVHNAGPVMEVTSSAKQLADLSAGRLAYLEKANVQAVLPSQPPKLGMCGLLDVYTPEGKVL